MPVTELDSDELSIVTEMFGVEEGKRRTNL